MLSYPNELGSAPAPVPELSPPAYNTGAGAAGPAVMTATNPATAAPPLSLPPLQAPVVDAYGMPAVAGGFVAPPGLSSGVLPDATATAWLAPTLLPLPGPQDPVVAAVYTGAGPPASCWPLCSPPRPPAPPPPTAAPVGWGAGAVGGVVEEEEEAGVDAPVALLDSGDASGEEGYAEEDDDAVTVREVLPSSDTPQADGLARLYVHPLAASASAAALGNSLLLPATDPITAALARQQQQLRRGEPHSPLSPRTLQAFAAATAAGCHSSFLAELTSDDVLAPPPLALTWYPAVPPGVTKFAERKRTAAGSAVADMQKRHELDMLAEEHEEGGGCSTEDLPARRRPRVEETARGSDSTAAEARGAWRHVDAGMGVGGTAVDGSAAEAASPAAARVLDGGHRKRERDERVYEFITRGRRLL